MTETKKQNAFVFYIRLLAYALIALMLRAAMLAPLACLFACEGWQRGLAIWSPLMAVFVVLPLRCSFAQAMVQKDRSFCFGTAFSFADYGKKLVQGLLHVLHVIKWGIPMAALLGGAYYCYTAVDALTIFQTINDLGNSCADLFGLSTENNFMLGIGAIGAVLGVGVLIWTWGAVRNSASRFIWALTFGTDANPRTEMRRCLKGRRMRQMCVSLINLMLLVPFLWASACALKGTLSDASTLLMMAITTGTLPKLDLIGAVLPVAVSFAGLYLPLLPLRRWNTAAFAMRSYCAKAEKKVSA